MTTDAILMDLRTAGAGGVTAPQKLRMADAMAGDAQKDHHLELDNGPLRG